MEKDGIKEDRKHVWITSQSGEKHSQLMENAKNMNRQEHENFMPQLINKNLQSD